MRISDWSSDVCSSDLMALRDNAYGVCRWDDRGPLITSARAPRQGRFSVADPRAISSREGSGFLGVNRWSGTVGVISSRGLPTNGSYSVADPRYGERDRDSTLGVVQIGRAHV